MLFCISAVNGAFLLYSGIQAQLEQGFFFVWELLSNMVNFLNDCVTISGELLSGNFPDLQKLKKVMHFLAATFKGFYLPYARSKIKSPLMSILVTFIDHCPFNFFVCLGTDFKSFSVPLWNMNILKFFRSFLG